MSAHTQSLLQVDQQPNAAEIFGTESAPPHMGGVAIIVASSLGLWYGIWKAAGYLFSLVG